jgi:hypothetical protein
MEALHFLFINGSQVVYEPRVAEPLGYWTQVQNSLQTITGSRFCVDPSLCALKSPLCKQGP